jgi:hypothetical protein
MKKWAEIQIIKEAYTVTIYVRRFEKLVMNYKQNKLRGMSPRANYTDRATAACDEVVALFCG